MRDDSDPAEPTPNRGADGARRPSTWQEFLRRLRELGCNYSRYRRIEEIGVGGQGVVECVEDVVSRRLLALKRLRRPAAAELGRTRDETDDALGRFLDEAQIQAQLDHPSIVPVHEIGLDDSGRVYFAMKLVKGEDLNELFAKVRSGEDGWTVERALQTIVRVCEAMAHAHSKRVIHRDLKPSNVMVGRFGEVFVMDWGLARILGEPDRLGARVSAEESQTRVEGARGQRADFQGTAIGTVLGTPYYMSPEQAAGRADEMGCGTDIYSVGAMLYQLLAGRRPYEDSTPDQGADTVVTRVRRGAPEPLMRLTKAPAALIAIVEKAMARAVEDRYPTMLQMAEDLRAYLEGRVVQAYGTGVWQELRSFARRNRRVVAVAAVAVLVVTLLGLAAIDQARQRVAAEQERVRQKDVTEAELRTALGAVQSARVDESAARKRAEALASTNANLAHAFRIQEANRLLGEGNLAETRSLLNDCPAEQRSFEWLHLAARSDNTPMRLAVGQSGVLAALSADGSSLVIDHRGQGGLCLLRSAGGDSLPLQPLLDSFPDSLFSRVALSRTGRYLAQGGRQSICLLDLEHQVHTTIGKHKREGVAHIYPIALDDEAQVVAYNYCEEVVVVDRLSGQTRTWVTPRYRDAPRDSRGGSIVADVGALTVSWSGARVAFAVGVEDGGSVWCWRSRHESNPVELKIDQPATSLAFSPDESLLAIGSGRLLQLWDCRNGTVIRVLPETARGQCAVTFAGSEKLLVSAGPTELKVIDVSSTLVVQTIRADMKAPLVAATADSVFASNGTGLLRWPMGADDCASRLPAVGKIVRVASGSDDAYLALGCLPNSPPTSPLVRMAGLSHALPRHDHVLLVDAPSGVPTALFPGSVFAFSPDGKKIAVAAGAESGSPITVDAPHLAIRSVRVHEIATGSWTDLGEVPAGTNCLAFHPGGGRLVAIAGFAMDLQPLVGFGPLGGARREHEVPVCGGGVKMWDLVTSRLIAERPVSAALLSSVAFRADGEVIYVGSVNGSVRELAAADLTDLRQLVVDAGDPVLAISVDPRGELLLVGRESGSVQAVGVATGEAVVVCKEQEPVADVAWHPRGESFAVVAGGRLRLRLRSGELVMDRREFGDRVAFSSDGRRLLGNQTILESDPARAAAMASGAQRVARVLDALQRGHGGDNGGDGDLLALMTRLPRTAHEFSLPDPAAHVAVVDGTATPEQSAAMETLYAAMEDSAPAGMLLVLAMVRIDAGNHDGAHRLLLRARQQVEFMKRVAGGLQDDRSKARLNDGATVFASLWDLVEADLCATTARFEEARAALERFTRAHPREIEDEKFKAFLSRIRRKMRD